MAKVDEEYGNKFLEPFLQTLSIQLMDNSPIVYSSNNEQILRASSLQDSMKKQSRRKGTYCEKNWGCSHGARFLAFVILYILKRILR